MSWDIVEAAESFQSATSPWTPACKIAIIGITLLGTCFALFRRRGALSLYLAALIIALLTPGLIPWKSPDYWDQLRQQKTQITGQAMILNTSGLDIGDLKSNEITVSKSTPYQQWQDAYHGIFPGWYLALAGLSLLILNLLAVPPKKGLVGQFLGSCCLLSVLIFSASLIRDMYHTEEKILAAMQTAPAQDAEAAYKTLQHILRTHPQIKNDFSFMQRHANAWHAAENAASANLFLMIQRSIARKDWGVLRSIAREEFIASIGIYKNVTQSIMLGLIAELSAESAGLSPTTLAENIAYNFELDQAHQVLVALQLFQTGNFREANDRFQSLADEQQSTAYNATLLAIQGLCMNSLGEYFLAREYFLASYELAPTNNIISAQAIFTLQQ